MVFTNRSDGEPMVPDFWLICAPRMATMSQKSSLLQFAKSDSLALIPDSPTSDRFQGLCNIEMDPTEAGRLDLAAGVDQLEQGRDTFLSHAKMVDRDLRQLYERSEVGLERGGIGIDFGMPSGDRVDAAGEGGDILHIVDVAPEQVE